MAHSGSESVFRKTHLPFWLTPCGPSQASLFSVVSPFLLLICILTVSLALGFPYHLCGKHSFSVTFTLSALHSHQCVPHHGYSQTCSASSGEMSLHLIGSLSSRTLKSSAPLEHSVVSSFLTNNTYRKLCADPVHPRGCSLEASSALP